MKNLIIRWRGYIDPRCVSWTENSVVERLKINGIFVDEFEITANMDRCEARVLFTTEIDIITFTLKYGDGVDLLKEWQ